MSATFAERTVERVSGWLAGRSFDRRRFLTRAAVVGSALAVDPVDYLLKPLPAYGLVTDCGSANDCGDGWTAFCATLSKGSNTCPPGSYVAGWWKVDSTSFCPDANGNPGTRYYIDCNRLPSASCSARCSGDPCDGRAWCRNNFRYGQCNQQIRGVTQVVCRVITCAPPWEYDPSCTTTVRTDNRTESHNSPYLAPRNASRIRLRWQDMGQTGSKLGRETMAERAGAGGGRVAGYEGGYLLYTATTGVHAVYGSIANRYAAMGLTESVLGYPVADDAAGPGDSRYSAFQHGRIWFTDETRAREVTRGIHERYEAEGGPASFLGFPASYERSVPAGRVRTDFTGGWSIVWDPATDESRIIPVDVEMPGDGSWPAQLRVDRWAGRTREETAANLSARVFAPGSPVAYVARADAFADALTGGVAAALAGGPVLLTERTRLSDPTRVELDRLRAGVIVVLGGTDAIGDEVEAALSGYADTVVRVSGSTRYGTAAAVSQRAFPDGARTCHVATGTDFAAALAGVPAAARSEGPLLLVEPDVLPSETRAEIERLGVRDVVILGGEGAVGAAVERALRDVVSGSVERRAGADRYATAAAVTAGFDDAGDVFVATGTDFPDGLAAGPAAVARDNPLLLTSTAGLPAATAAELRRLSPSRLLLLGGEAAVSEEAALRLSYVMAR